MTELTHLEKIVLNAIAHHEMNPGNGARPTCAADVCTWCWAGDFTGGEMTTAQVKGVLSSLIKKGMINVSGGGRESTASFTQAGFEAFVAAFPE